MPDSAVVLQMRQFKADLLRDERTQMREMARRWLAVERRLDGNLAALAERMAAVQRDGGTITNGMLYGEERYRALIGQLTQELDKYSDYAERTIEQRQRQLATLGINHAESSIRVQGVGVGFNRLPIEAVQNMVGLAGNRSPLRSLLVASWPDGVEGLTQALINGVALGWNPRKVAREMARGSARSLDRMMVIARTEQLRVYREANMQSYIASGVVESYMRLATHDARVCPMCLLLEGTIYPLNVMMPTHPQCRCTLVPNVAGIPSPKWQKGETWLKEQPAATQRSILGNGRYDAWQAGKFDLMDIVQIVPNPIWGDTLRSRPLQELIGA